MYRPYGLYLSVRLAMSATEAKIQTGTGIVKKNPVPIQPTALVAGSDSEIGSPLASVIASPRPITITPKVMINAGIRPKVTPRPLKTPSALPAIKAMNMARTGVVPALRSCVRIMATIPIIEPTRDQFLPSE